MLRVDRRIVSKPLTLTQAARVAGVSRQALHDAIKRGTLQARKIKTPAGWASGFYFLIEHDELERYMRGRQ